MLESLPRVFQWPSVTSPQISLIKISERSNNRLCSIIILKNYTVKGKVLIQYRYMISTLSIQTPVRLIAP